MKKRSLTIFLLLALTKIGLAEVVPVEKAKSVASGFFNNALQQNSSMRMITDLELVQTTNINARESAPAYYIFANKTGSGFVIVAGDDVVAPIIGYSLENTIDVTDLPPGFVAYMEAQTHNIERAKQKSSRTSVAIENSWNAPSAAMAVSVVGPLIKVAWGQGEYYNDKCPIIKGEHAKVGCTATAMGQVMQYWNYPVKGSGKKGDVDFGNTTYDWANMPKKLDKNSSSKQVKAISTLLYHCGVSVGMDYGVEESGANISATSFEKYFGYDDDARFVHKYDYSTDEWKDLLKGQLDDGQPIIYAGWAERKMIFGFPSYRKGHTWMVDGYDSDGKFHMNWGWNGSKTDGYYQITDLEPNEDEYRYQNQAVIDLVKPKRIKLSEITSTLTTMCTSKSFECSVKKHADIVAVNWIVPKGWSVDGQVSKGVAIKAGIKVKIDPPNPFDKVPVITLRAIGLTKYGENTLARSISIITGKPGFTKDKTIWDVGSALHCFTPSKGAIIQIQENGVWKNMSCIELFNGTKKTVNVRASNSCGLSGVGTFLLTSPIDPDNKNLSNDDKNTALSLDQEQLNGSGITIYPNPANDFIAIKSQKKIREINCLNVLGEIVILPVQGNSLSTTTLKKGLYLLYVTTQDGEVSVHKFIKE